MLRRPSPNPRPAGAAQCGLDHLRVLRRGLDADGEAVSVGQQQAVTPGAGQQPSLEYLGQVDCVAHGAYGRRVLLEQELEGAALKQGATGMADDVTRRVLGEEILDVLGDELESQAVLPGPPNWTKARTFELTFALEI